MDRIIISTTPVVEQNTDFNQLFAFKSICDNDNGILKLLNKDSVNHITHLMTLANGLWYHNLSPTHSYLAIVNRMYDACFSNRLHVKLAYADDNIISTVHQ